MMDEHKPKAGNGAAPQVTPVPSESLHQATTQDPQAMEYVMALLQGKLQPKTRYESDLVVQVREAEAEINTLRNRLEHLATETERVKTRRIALIGIVQQLALNLAKWRSDGDLPQAAKPD